MEELTKTKKNLQSEQLVSRPWFEPGTSRRQNSISVALNTVVSSSGRGWQLSSAVCKPLPFTCISQWVSRLLTTETVGPGIEAACSVVGSSIGGKKVHLSPHSIKHDAIKVCRNGGTAPYFPLAIHWGIGSESRSSRFTRVERNFVHGAGLCTAPVFDNAWTAAV
jgi:hypothetical protein